MANLFVLGPALQQQGAIIFARFFVEIVSLHEQRYAVGLQAKLVPLLCIEWIFKTLSCPPKITLYGLFESLGVGG